MNWITVLAGILKIVSALAGYLRDRGLITEAQAGTLGDVLAAQAFEIDKGRAARLAQRAADAQRLPDDPGPNDPFLRSD